MSAYMEHIDLTMLPQTIRDAIYVTHRLEIDLLWTDSLCIIQDSPEDKHRELISMRNVYRNAYLTIDAASADKASNGFLEDRPPLRPELVLPFICPRDATTPFAALGKIDIYLEKPVSRHQDVRTNSHKNHTAQRAWCLQETMLSTRSLVFTPATVQLRCHTATQNIGGAEHSHYGDVPRLPDIVLNPDRPVERYSDEWVDIRRRWYKVAWAYSRRKLSYPLDKLVACAGLAEMFATALGSAYVAGLWNDDYLLRDLLWYYLVPVPSHQKEYLAPSWSWASVEHARLRYPYALFESRTVGAVVGCATTTQDDAFPFGPVTGGQLRLRARLHLCRVKVAREGQAPDMLVVTVSGQGTYLLFHGPTGRSGQDFPHGTDAA